VGRIARSEAEDRVLQLASWVERRAAARARMLRTSEDAVPPPTPARVAEEAMRTIGISRRRAFIWAARALGEYERRRYAQAIGVAHLVLEDVRRAS
jgi:hypothetical protein